MVSIVWIISDCGLVDDILNIQTDAKPQEIFVRGNRSIYTICIQNESSPTNYQRLSVIKPIGNDYGSSGTVSGGGGSGSVDITRIGLAAFGLVLAQGVIVGIIFGIITAKIKRLHITNIRKGLILGLATGVIACLVLFVSIILTVYSPLLTNALARYTQTIPFSLQGLHTHVTTQSQNSYLSILLGYGLFAYLVYGLILGGILVWPSSLYRFNMSKAAEFEKYR